jgi:hypothetical protein
MNRRTLIETAAASGGGADAREFGGKMGDAWIAFARSGNPNLTL